MNRKRFLSLVYSCTNKKLYISLFFTLLCILMASLFNVTLPIILKKIVDILTQNLPLTSIASIFILYALVMILERLFNEIQFVIYSSWQSGVLKSFYQKIFDSLFLNKNTFFTKTLHGSITSKIYQAAYGLDTFMFDFIFKIIPVIVQFILILSSITFIFDFKMALIICSGAITYSGLLYIFNGRLIKYQNKIRNNNVHAQGKTTDLINSWKDIKLTNSYIFAKQQLLTTTNKMVDSTRDFFLRRGFYGFIQTLPICLIFIIANYRAILSYKEGIATIGSIILVNNYLYQILRPLESFSLLFRSLSKSYSDFSQIDDILNFEKESKGIQINPLKINFATITIHNLCVNGILNHLNLSIKRGERIAVIGNSGSGKTTFLNVLAGLETNYVGQVMLDKINIKEISIGDLRSQISYLTSDSRLISETLANNLMLGRNLNPKKALHFSHLFEKINTLPDGLDTLINEHETFSAGEAQRLKIARHYLLNCPIELYDEATSALNHELEEKIIDNILSRKDKTIIFVTHKTNFLNKFDCVYKLHNGCLINITEDFSHAY